MSLKSKTLHFLHPKIGEIWCLHRVLPERSAFKSNRELEITPEYLERLIQERRSQGFHFVDLATVLKAAKGAQKERNLIHVTFDDGFADVYTNAYPVLKKYQIPFTLYVTTGMPDGNADLWWYQLQGMAEGNAAWFEDVMKRVYDSRNPAATMHEITSSGIDQELCSALSLSWDQIRVMCSEGLCTVGSHGLSHSALTLLPVEQACRELKDSKRRLEEVLGKEVQHFSYPHSFFNEATNQWVWQAGYQTAVLGYGGAVRRKRGNRLFYRTFIVQP